MTFLRVLGRELGKRHGDLATGSPVKLIGVERLYHVGGFMLTRIGTSPFVRAVAEGILRLIKP